MSSCGAAPPPQYHQQSVFSKEAHSTGSQDIPPPPRGHEVVPGAQAPGQGQLAGAPAPLMPSAVGHGSSCSGFQGTGREGVHCVGRRVGLNPGLPSGTRGWKGPQGSFCSSPHFVDGETEAPQRGGPVAGWGLTWEKQPHLLKPPHEHCYHCCRGLRG